MQPPKSYMLPKLISLNMLALMVMSFEHDAPADHTVLVSDAQSSEVKPVPPDTRSSTLVAAPLPLVKVATTAEEKPAATHKHTLQKKRVNHVHVATKPHVRPLHARYVANAPVDCCFRGNHI